MYRLFWQVHLLQFRRLRMLILGVSSMVFYLFLLLLLLFVMPCISVSFVIFIYFLKCICLNNIVECVLRMEMEGFSYSPRICAHCTPPSSPTFFFPDLPYPFLPFLSFKIWYQHSFHTDARRADMIRRKDPGPYEDLFGPTVLGIMLMLSIVAQFSIKLYEIM
mmetsp:Transcript_45531/g.68703  ORF Transcript_45531/g.68703 Transcript_45531/m.68703 type:complete len:163 (+) Transcript_45531:577-1065(+)